MIKRFTRPKMADLFSEIKKKGNWHLVETAVLKVRERLGQIGPGVSEAVATIVVTEEILKRADEIEAVTDHDLIAFIKAVAELLTEKARPHYHEGLTSFDDEDTGLALTMVAALDLIIPALERFSVVLRDLAKQHRNIIMVGRTHNIHAKPITFGLKVLNWLEAIEFHIKQLRESREIVGVGKLSGAVGTYALEPQVEALACAELGLKPARISTQVVSRHIHVHYAMALVATANTLDKIATDIRLLAGTDVGEVAEFKAVGAKGSSAMPGKSRLRNPIKTENVCSLAKVARGYIIPALECQILWHERTLDNSAAERVWLPDLTTIVHFMIERLADTVAKLEIYPQQMLANLDKTGGIVYAESLMNALTKKGMDRQQAYELVEGLALRVEPGIFETPEGDSFKHLASYNPAITDQLTESEIEECFDPWQSLKHVDETYARFGM